MSKRKTTQEFIQEANLIHNNKYNYSKTEYVDAHTKVIITCPIHGDFKQIPAVHLRGNGCSKCSGKFHHTTETFIEEANKVHNNKYDYSKVNYINNSTKVCIICPEHGEFWQTPNHHLRGRGCPKCGGTAKSNTLEFIEKAKAIHGNKYDYSKVEYINDRTKVRIICHNRDRFGNEHGEFWQTPNSHLRGEGCPNCISYKGEEAVQNYLIDKDIKFITQFKINVPKTVRILGFLKVDFYIPSLNTIIEYNGKQHYIANEHFGGQIALDYQIIRDEYLREYCKNNKIKLIEIPYTERDNIDNYLDNKLNNVNTN